MFNNPQLQLAFDFVQYTNKSIFLTGKAGTGKTTFLHNLRKVSPKRTVVVAPTGVAAINAGGVTMHSFFQMSFGPQISESILPREIDDEVLNLKPSPGIKKFNKEKIRLIQSIDLLVIDEISMVRSDMLDAVDEVLRKYKNRYLPFGGVQLLMIGDLHQLAPIVRDNEWALLSRYYDTAYFFGSRALQKSGFLTIELTEIFRQNDRHFINLLGEIRNSNMNDEVLTEINKRYIPRFNPADSEGYITLTTHNANASEINRRKLNEISSKAFKFEALIDGDFPEYAYPTDAQLSLKKDAQVMFVKNDISREKQYYNGKIGKITEISDDAITVKCPEDSSEIIVDRVEWQNVKFFLDEKTKEVKEDVIGTFFQYPLKLAWAITIHKSQGLTFDRAIIDAQAAFAYGQVYVALSRCRTLDGLVLSTPILQNGVKADIKISDFSQKASAEIPGEAELNESKIEFQRDLLIDLFDFNRIEKTFSFFKKFCAENSNIIDATVMKEIDETEKNAGEHIFSVAKKFLPQLTSMCNATAAPENSPELQERLKKASEYFIEKLNLYLNSFFDSFIPETDNKAVKSQINELVEKIRLLTFVKVQCLQHCSNGFETLNFIKVKSNAEIDFSLQQMHKRQAKVKTPSHISHPELYNELKQWRKETAEEINAKAFMILHQKHILELLKHLPRSYDELAQVKGFGQKRIAQFGGEILYIIRQYCERKEMGSMASDIGEIKISEKKSKINTKRLSYDLYRSGKKIQEIAEERNLTYQTIEGHLMHYVSLGEIDISEFLPKLTIEEIREFFIANKTTSINEAKSFFGEKYSFSEIKFVLHSIRAIKQGDAEYSEV